MIRHSQSIRRSTTLTAGILSAVLTVVPPAIYFVMAFSHMTGVIETEGEINARVVGTLVVANPRMWEFEELRLKELLARRSTETAEKRVLYNLQGQVIAESSDKMLPPLLSQTFPVHDAGHQVANLVVSRSLAPTLMVTALLFCLGALAAGFTFFRLRTVPLRAIDNAYRSLKQSEEKYRSVYESLNEGLALYRTVPGSGTDIDLVLADINPAAASVFGFGRDDIGKSILQVQGGLFAPVREALQGAPAEVSLELTQEGAGRVFVVNAFPMGDGMVATLLEDVTEKKRSAEQLEHLAYYDSLTGLLNRRMLLDRMEHTIGIAQREGLKMATLFFDLNGFKPINDTMGHEAGDQILIEVGQRLKSSVRKKDTLARLGGDEFVVVATLDTEDNASCIAQNLLRKLSPVYEVGGREVYVGASIGISVYPDDGTTPETLLKNADIAMYNAKKPGVEFCFYSTQMNQKLQERTRLEFELWMALEREEFFLEYQPIMDARTGRIAAVEALVRWMSPEKGRVMPDSFIPLAEATGIIIPLGEWVLKTACNKLRQWLDAGCLPLRMSVNISGCQFMRSELCRLVEEAAEQSGVDLALLELELTETCLVKNVEETATKLWHLKGLNVSIGIDDFGTGYSSLQYLKNFPIDHLKIDRAFIRNVCELPDERAIVDAIIGIAKAMELHVIAEGVETREQAEFLAQRGCDELQGYYYHRPLSEERLLEVLRDERERRETGAGTAGAGEAGMKDAGVEGAPAPVQPV
ncbi:putative bifunctional diguanylate cyclase/phosphodiesterase [Geomonas subterranea]|uniref:EAL domain-containing protein n=1 Tax=Geomonas subterranea TaxID=2847989 RepID=A0ABX8LBG8_9BACT|nr:MULTISPECIES: EAL domain-containing protein [Geomonas]QXE89360.1 EAL domain-containing protein [Geomonas subterranea]QXM08525.1 EAL domain-containing protein [Geomonas subterranea]